jgi:hypothetical protein
VCDELDLSTAPTSAVRPASEERINREAGTRKEATSTASGSAASPFGPFRAKSQQLGWRRRNLHSAVDLYIMLKMASGRETSMPATESKNDRKVSVVLPCLNEAEAVAVYITQAVVSWLSWKTGPPTAPWRSLNASLNVMKRYFNLELALIGREAYGARASSA